jgi:hypothetical protein
LIFFSLAKTTAIERSSFTYNKAIADFIKIYIRQEKRCAEEKYKGDEEDYEKVWVWRNTEKE